MIRLPMSFATFEEALSKFPVDGVKRREMAVVLAARYYGYPTIGVGNLPPGKTSQEMQADLDRLYEKRSKELGPNDGQCLLMFTNTWREIPTAPKNAWRDAWGIQKGSLCYGTHADLSEATFQSNARTACPHCKAKLWPNGQETYYCDYQGVPTKQPEDGYRAEQNAPKLFRHDGAQYYILNLDSHPDTLRQLLRGTRLPFYPTLAALYYGSPELLKDKVGRNWVGASDLAHDFKLSREQIEIMFDLDPDLPANKAVLAMTEAALVNRITDDIYVKHKPMRFSAELLARYYLSLKAKPFVLLTGISGTGKTQIARRVSERLGGDVPAGSPSPVEVVAVRPDWVDNTGLMGSHNPLLQRFRRSAALAVTLRAYINLVTSPTAAQPHFLLLDEMNLSRVEYYFSDFLSNMEARDPKLFFDNTGDLQTAVRRQPTFELHQEQRCVTTKEDDGAAPSGICRSKCDECPLRFLLTPEAATTGTEEYHARPGDFVPPRLFVPFNLYVTGTVNVDETTHPFSSKVLDRANVIEFNDVILDLTPPGNPGAAGAELTAADLNMLSQLFAQQPGGPHNWSADIALSANVSSYVTELKRINKVLELRNLHFGYRVRNEILRFLHQAEGSSLVPPSETGDLLMEDAFDMQFLQKVLPKLNGSEGKLGAILSGLYDLCWEGTPARKLTEVLDGAEMDKLLAQLKETAASRELTAPLGAWATPAEQNLPANGNPPDGAAPVDAAATPDEATIEGDAQPNPEAPDQPRLRYPRTARKIAAMWRRMQDDGFTGFFE